MGQLLIRQLDDDALARLRVRARAQRTSVEALARQAVHEAAKLSVDEKLELVARMQEWSRRARDRTIPQTLGVELIRESRDLDH